MKRFWLLALSLLMMVGLASCAGKQPAQSSEGAVSEEPPEEEGGLLLERVIIEGASLYRGTVEVVEREDETTIVTLTQAKGKDFGMATIKARIAPDTEANGAFSTNELIEGAFLEVYYTAQETVGEEVEAVAVNYLYTEDATNHNGVVKAVWMDPDRPDSGSITMADLDTEEETVFKFGDITQMQIDIGDVGEGDKLNILTSLEQTASIPPQMTALEISAYQE